MYGKDSSGIARPFLVTSGHDGGGGLAQANGQTLRLG